MINIDSNLAIYIANGIVVAAVYCLVKPLRVSIDNLAEKIQEMNEVNKNHTADIVDLKMRMSRLETAVEHYHTK